jgi:hypothetical protein
MSTVFKPGNWFSNAKSVLDKTQNLDSNGNLTGQLTGTETTYTADGAIALTDRVAILNSTSATTDMTLADGTYIGQEIVIACIVQINSCTVTLTTPLGLQSDVLTFSTSDLAIVRWTSEGWAAVQGITAA